MKVDEVIKANNLVIVTGHSGSGKSAIIQHIALQYRKRGWTIKPVYSFREIHEVYKCENFEQDKYIFIFNDPFGKESYDEISYNEWWRYREILYILVKKGKLLLTCRESIFCDPRAKRFFEQNLEKNENNDQTLKKIDINDSHNALRKKEKKTLFKKYLPDAKPTKKDFDKICEIGMYFPLFCKLCKGNLMHTKNIVNVFREPTTVLKTEIETYKVKDKETYCGLVCLILCKNNLCVGDLEKNTALFSKCLNLCELPSFTSPSTIINKLKPLCGLFVRKIGEQYSFYHDFVMEVTTYVLGSEYPQVTIEFADLGFIRKRIRLENIESNPLFTILLDREHIRLLVDRLFEELIGERFIEVILNPCLRNEDVIKHLKRKLKDLADEGKLELITKPQNTKTEKKEFQHLMNESWYTRLEFVSSEIECSPLFALITFCHNELSKFCLELLAERKHDLLTRLRTLFSNLLKNRKTILNKNCLFVAICANGDNDFLQHFTDTEIVECEKIKWNKKNLIHIISVFHNYTILDSVCNKDTNIDIFTSGENPMTPLMMASGNHNQEIIGEEESPLNSTGSIRRNKMVEALITRGANVNLCNEKGISPLYKACQNGHESTAQILLNNGADVNFRTNKGASPLYIACRNGHEGTAQVLLNNGAEVNLCNNNESSPLWKSCQFGHTRTAHLLLKNGANVNLCDQDGISPLYIACQKGHESTAQLLILNSADVNLCDLDGISPLLWACQKALESTIKLLLINGAYINLYSDEKTSPLLLACEKGYDSVVQLLLNNGANINFSTDDVPSALYIACKNGHENIAQFLIKHGANVNLCNQFGRRPFIMGHLDECESYVQRFVFNCADVNLCQKERASPLHLACKNGHKSIAQLLLNNGAEVNLSSNNGITPLWISCFEGHDSTIQLLLNNGANVNFCGDYQYSPLTVACLFGHESTVWLLLNNGANVNFCNKKGFSFIWIACINKHKNIAELLKNNGCKFINFFEKQSSSSTL
ncbi:uncharacterized protein LOC144623789 [Crassostrea virginica]